MCKKIIAVLCFLGIAISFAGCADTSKTATDTAQVVDFFQDDTLNKNFEKVCEQIEINSSEVKNIEKTDDWVGGPRYTFVYQGMSFRLYCNVDSTIESVKIGTEFDVYKKGYEPYRVPDCIPTSEEQLQLQMAGKDTVKSFLNYPESADFHVMEWGFGKNHDLYTVTGVVTAQNAFGVEEDISFAVVYHLQDTNMSVIYVRMNEAVQIDEMQKYPLPERKLVEDKIQISADSGKIPENAIVLVDGELGEYGVEDNINGEVYVDFYIPEGTYEVTNLSNWCKVFVIDNQSNEPVLTIELTEANATNTLTVGPNQHIELTIKGKVSLMKD